MVRTARAVMLAALVALLAGAILDGLAGLAAEDWTACLAHSDGGALGPPRLAERPALEVLRLFASHMADSARGIWHAGPGFGAQLILIALVWMPPFLLALPIGLARRRATRFAFAIAVLGLVAVFAALMLPPATAHDCDRKGVRMTLLLAPFIALAAAGLAAVSSVFAGRLRAHHPATRDGA